MTISLRDELPADDSFLRSLIVDHVAAQLGAAAWPEPLRSQLLGIQYTSRRDSIRTSFPDHRSRIIQIDGADAGWLVTADLPADYRLVEIILVPEFRSRGAGAEVVDIVLREAARKPVRLSVDTANPAAIRLYERLGFRRIGGDEVRHTMERPARPL